MNINQKQVAGQGGVEPKHPFSMDAKDGQTVEFFDQETGAKLEGYEGPYFSNGHLDKPVMYTWLADGERHFSSHPREEHERMSPPPPASEPAGRISLRTFSKSLTMMTDEERHAFWSSEMKRGAEMAERLGYDAIDGTVVRRSECLVDYLRETAWGWDLGEDGKYRSQWRKAPEAWMQAVFNEVGKGVYQSEEVPEGLVSVHLRIALHDIAEAIWFKEGATIPECAARYFRKHAIENEHVLRGWRDAHPRHQSFFEDQVDKHLPGAEERLMLQEAYEAWVDKVAILFCESMRTGAGAVNPKIPLGPDGFPLKSTDLGGYPLYYVTKDGGVLSPEAVIENLALTNNPDDPQWYVVQAQINYEDKDLVCDHTGQRIASAYGED
jgi:hypothetical protein